MEAPQPPSTRAPWSLAVILRSTPVQRKRRVDRRTPFLSPSINRPYVFPVLKHLKQTVCIVDTCYVGFISNASARDHRSTSGSAASLAVVRAAASVSRARHTDARPRSSPRTRVGTSATRTTARSPAARRVRQQSISSRCREDGWSDGSRRAERRSILPLRPRPRRATRPADDGARRPEEA